MIVFVAGMPRAGSMWTYNVVRAILDAKGISVLPKEVPVSNGSADEVSRINNALLSAVKKDVVHCIKTHLSLKNTIPTKHEVKVICNLRDVRDACLSYIRFERTSFEHGINAMNGMMQTTDYYLTTFGDNLHKVRYEDLVNNPHYVLEGLMSFLQIDLSEDEKRGILQKFQKSSVQNILRDISKEKLDTNHNVNVAEQGSPLVFIKNRDGTYRAMDKITGFQGNHITSKSDGEWRTYFDKNQSDRLSDLSKEWLLKYGYEV